MRIEDAEHLRLRAGALEREAKRMQQKADFMKRYAQNLRARAKRLETEEQRAKGSA